MLTKDFIGGVILLIFGSWCAIYAQRYDFGAVARMGPGFFPIILGVLIAFIGLILILVSLRIQGAKLPKIEYSSLGYVLLGIVLFALTISTAGLIVATIITVLVSSLPDKNISWRNRILLCIGVTFIVSVLFKELLKVSVPYIG